MVGDHQLLVLLLLLLLPWSFGICHSPCSRSFGADCCCPKEKKNNNNLYSSGRLVQLSNRDARDDTHFPHLHCRDDDDDYEYDVVIFLFLSSLLLFTVLAFVCDASLPAKTSSETPHIQPKKTLL